MQAFRDDVLSLAKEDFPGWTIGDAQIAEQSVNETVSSVLWFRSSGPGSGFGVEYSASFGVQPTLDEYVLRDSGILGTDVAVELLALLDDMYLKAYESSPYNQLRR